MVRNRFALLALGLTLLAVGCGGDGSSINNGAIANQTGTQKNTPDQPSSGDVGIFVTNSGASKYDHAWVLVKKIELKLAAGGTRVIFDDDRGVGFDVISLRDKSGSKYRFINELTLPAGTYMSAQITVGKNAILFPAKATSGKATPFAGDGDKDKTFTVAFDPPKMIGTGHDDLVFDFDTSKWKVDNDKIGVTVSSSLGAGLEDADRNSTTVQSGIVDQVKGEVPEQNFRLTNAKSADVSVFTTKTTAVLSSDTTKPFVLTKGQKLEVSGTFDTNTRRFDATSIYLRDPKATASPQVLGVVSTFDPKKDSLEMTPELTRGLLPDGLSVSVSLGSTARFFGSSGLEISKDDFFAALSDNSVHVLAEGSYDAAKNQFTANEVRLQDPSLQPAVKVGGFVNGLQADAQTFNVVVNDYQGLMTKPGVSTTVKVDANTKFVDGSGKELKPEDFFAQLATPKVAAVDGVLDFANGTVNATSVKLSDAPAAIVKAAEKAAKTAAKKTAPKK